MSNKLSVFFDLLQGFRKFIVMMLLIIIGVVFRIENLISGSDFVNLLTSTTVAFMSANAIERIGDVIKTHILSKNNASQKSN